MAAALRLRLMLQRMVLCVAVLSLTGQRLDVFLPRHSPAGSCALIRVIPDAIARYQEQQVG
jgi:hypothetical protein